MAPSEFQRCLEFSPLSSCCLSIFIGQISHAVVYEKLVLLSLPPLSGLHFGYICIVLRTNTLQLALHCAPVVSCLLTGSPLNPIAVSLSRTETKSYKAAPNLRKAIYQNVLVSPLIEPRAYIPAKARCLKRKSHSQTYEAHSLPPV